MPSIKLEIDNVIVPLIVQALRGAKNVNAPAPKNKKIRINIIKIFGMQIKHGFLIVAKSLSSKTKSKDVTKIARYIMVIIIITLKYFSDTRTKINIILPGLLFVKIFLH